MSAPVSTDVLATMRFAVLDAADAEQAEAREQALAAVAGLLDELRVFRAAFLVAVSDKSPFAKEALRRIDAAFIRTGATP